MKLIVAAGREYNFTEKDFELLDKIHRRHKITEVISGSDQAPDLGGEGWAKRNGITVIYFLPQRGVFGTAALSMSTAAMADYADALLLFPGGMGAFAIRQAAEKNKARVLIHKLTNDGENNEHDFNI